MNFPDHPTNLCCSFFLEVPYMVHDDRNPIIYNVTICILLSFGGISGFWTFGNPTGLSAFERTMILMNGGYSLAMIVKGCFSLPPRV